MSRAANTGAIRLVVGFSPGSASDNVARALAPQLALILGRPVEIELHPGENGAVGARLAAAARPDGHTLFVATLGTHALAPHLERDPGYDPLADFEPVALIARSPLVLACHPSLPAATVRELIALSQARLGALTYATSAIGGAPHLAAVLFEDRAGVTMRHVRYDHTGRLYDDLVAGRVDLSFNNLMSMQPRLQAGELRGLAVTGTTSSAIVPGLPTLGQAGLPGYEVTNWLGIVAPRRTPPGAVAQLAEALAAAARSEALAKRWMEAGIESPQGTPDDFAAFIRLELERWRPLAHRLHAQAEQPESSGR